MKIDLINRFLCYSAISEGKGKMNKPYEGYFETFLRSRLYYMNAQQRKSLECLVKFLLWRESGRIPEGVTIWDVIRGGLELFRTKIYQALMI
jgi:hypothetical protein